jgi:hypothetical protein
MSGLPSSINSKIQDPLKRQLAELMVAEEALMDRLMQNHPSTMTHRISLQKLKHVGEEIGMLRECIIERDNDAAGRYLEDYFQAQIKDGKTDPNAADPEKLKSFNRKSKRHEESANELRFSATLQR